MQTVQILGGDYTTSSRTAQITVYGKMTLSTVDVPIKLVDSTSYRKWGTITVNVGSASYSESFNYDTTETENKIITVNVGCEVDVQTIIKITASLGNAYVNYGSTVSGYTLPGQIVVDSNGFNAYLTMDVVDVWDESADNNGYAYISGYPPDESEFSGYEEPKPLNSWKQDSNNNGYAWTWGFTETPASTISLYLKEESGFTPLYPYLKAESGLVAITQASVKA